MGVADESGPNSSACSVLIRLVRFNQGSNSGFGIRHTTDQSLHLLFIVGRVMNIRIRIDLENFAPFQPLKVLTYNRLMKFT